MSNSLFGGKPKRPRQQVAQPVQEIQQSNIADETVRKNLAKRRRATILNQVTGEANISRKTLGAG
jgi:hypothetical protein